MATVGGIGGTNSNAGVYQLVQQYMSLEQTEVTAVFTRI